MTFEKWLAHAAKKLKLANVPSARLDAELLAAAAAKQTRTWLIAHTDEAIDVDAANALLERRLNREPIAYITRHKEFYGRDFTVTPDTLIPRPETETMIELLAPLVKQAKTLVDVGTGSGAIAVSAKLEYPHLTVTATDVSQAALEVACRNADALGADVAFVESDLLERVSQTFDLICANLPYVDTSWYTSPETEAEPALALFAEDGGLELIKRLIMQRKEHQPPGGYLLLEADPRQHDEIISFARNHGYRWHQTEGYCVVLENTAA